MALLQPYPNVSSLLTSTSDTTSTQQAGTRFWDPDTGAQYQYVKYSATATAAAANGTVVYLKSYTSYTVTDTLADALAANANWVCGVMVGAVAAGSFGLMQVGGPHATVKTNGDDDIAQNDKIIGGGTGTCDSVAAASASAAKVLGYATAADVDANNTVAAQITIGYL